MTTCCASQPYYWRTSTPASPSFAAIGPSYFISGDAFPNSPSSAWYLMDLRVNVGGFTPASINPTFATFVNGNWTGNLTVNQLASGMHIHADDGAGNTGDSDLFDVLPPTPAAPDLQPLSDTGLSNTDNITNLNNSSPGGKLQFSVDNTVAGATVTLYDGGNAIGSAVATGTATLVTTDGSTTLTDATHVMTARQTIGSLQSSDSPSLSITIDTIVPLATTALDLQVASDSGISATDNLTNIITPTFDVSALPYFRIYRNGLQVSSDFQTGSTFTSAALTDGTYSFAVAAVDAAGNVSLTAALSVTIDTIAPTPSAAPALQAASDSGISNSDGITNVARPTFDLPVAPYLRVYRNGDLLSSDYYTPSTFTTPVQSDGNWSHALTAVDAAGNESLPSIPARVTIDTVAPAAPAAPDLQAASDTGMSTTDHLTNIKTPTLDVAGGPYFRMYRNGSQVSSDFQTGSTFTSAALSDGTYNFSYTAVDAVGNVSSPGSPLSLTIDTKPWTAAGLLDPTLNGSGVVNSPLP